MSYCFIVLYNETQKRDQFKKLWRNDKSIIFVVFKLPGLCHQITNILTV